MDEATAKCLRTAISLIKDNTCNRVDLGHNTIVYKVPSGSPKKYTIRVDIKVEDGE